MKISQKPDLLLLREALEASWDEKTSYLAVQKEGIPALGQCYPTAWVVQHFFPKTEIIKGNVWNGKEIEVHFWNGLFVDGDLYHIDLSWQQFPAHSSVKVFEILDRKLLNDSKGTNTRCEILLNRVIKYVNLHNKKRNTLKPIF
jgi:hypothetical protein